MNLTHKIAFLLFFLSLFNGFSQQNQTLMKINGKNISVEEFENLYTKNIELVQDSAQKNIDNYKELFVHFKLELEDAYQKKYDTLSSFKKEWQQYRNELAKKYLSDEKVIDTLTREAYDRMKQDVKVSHILISIPGEGSPEDTLKAYNKILSIYKRLSPYKKALEGEGFKKLAKKYSQDPSARSNGGSLGYINVFHTVYPFENMAYNTPVGKTSKPFRTKFGYHILKVEDKRKARGEIEVAHIFVRENKKNPQEAQQKIEALYQKIVKKEDRFENLARKYSEDKSSARSEGRLRKFGIREMIPEFEDQAFSLKKPGDISKPFKSRYGWHIIKLIRKYPVPDFKEIKNDLRYKVSRDERSKLGKEKLYLKIQHLFSFQEKTPLSKILPTIDHQFFKNNWQIPQSKLNNQTLFIINNDKHITINEFYKYLYKHQQKESKKIKNKKAFIAQLYADFKKKAFFDYYNRHLEKLYPEFAQIVKEYKEGLLLFNIKSDRVWNKAIKDTTGLRKYFQSHKEKYRVPEQYVIFTAQTNSKKTAKKIEKALKKGKDIEKIKKQFGNRKILFQQKKVLKNSPLLKRLQLNNKKTVRYKDNKEYMIVHLVKKEKSFIPSLEKVRGKVINDYQLFLEKEWIKQLKAKYPVIIIEKTWQKLREKYKK